MTGTLATVVREIRAGRGEVAQLLRANWGVE
jgi:hypothetical protein